MAHDARVWVLTFPGRPMIQNKYRNLHRYARAAYDKQWRHDGFILARKARIPLLETCSVVVTPTTRTKVQADTAACAATVKAIIDGMVDAGVLVDDTGAHLYEITFRAPVKTGVDSLVVEVHDHVGHGGVVSV